MRQRGVHLVWVYAMVLQACTLFNINEALESLNFKELGSMVDRRIDLCQQRDAQLRNELKMEDALRGIHITAVAAVDAPIWIDEKADGTQSGFHPELMRALADSAGFTYTIAVHERDAFKPELTWSEYLERSTLKFDINLGWCAAAHSGRLVFGLRFDVAFFFGGGGAVTF